MGLVTIHSGKLQGSESDGIHSFKGIPFAAPISGRYRWMAPQPVESWSGERDATRFGNICPQQEPPNKWLAGPSGRKFIETLWHVEPQDDDCLNLNVWTRTLDPDAKLPVMFWIHGGAYTTGSGSLPIYDGTNLAKKDVVVVTINYRLGMMGSFIAPGMFDQDFCQSNRGFLDQMAALEWVQRNIRQFGGDPDNVTIFGESAGGQSVAVLTASPKANQLFRRAIVQSGTPEIGTRIHDHEQFAKDVFKALELNVGDPESLIQMTAVDTVRAAKAIQKVLIDGDESQYGSLKMYGNIGCIYGDDFLPTSILDALETGVAQHIEFMIGTVKEDGRLFPLVMPGPESFTSWLSTKYFQAMMLPKNDPDQVYENYAAVMPNATKKDIRGQIITDAMFRRGSVKAAELQACHQPSATYLYQFDWASPVGSIGAMHGLDVPFTNNNLDAASPMLGEIEGLRQMAEDISDAWVSFAKTGKPASANLPEWPVFDPSRRATMVLNQPSTLAYDVDPAMRAIWYG